MLPFKTTTQCTLLPCCVPLLQHYTPEPPSVDVDDSEAPTLQFTYVECLLFSFHKTVQLVSVALLIVQVYMYTQCSVQSF